jgi:glutamyl-tRNA(Gln) amidotransferase subunit D
MMADAMKYAILETSRGDVEGLLVKEDEKHITIKLKSGYNIGIRRNKIKKISYKDGITTEKRSAEHAHQDHTLPKVLILHTGGTIASKVDYQTGAVTPRFSPTELLGMFPELKDLANVESRLLRNMASDDMRFAHYNLMATGIAEEIKKDSKIKGIIITQGTDTIHYTSAALSFIFEHLNIPIVIVGSQRSSDRGSSDAAVNLISAVTFICNTTLSGVFICMHENLNDDTCSILNGLNARKMHSSRRDAFKQINGKTVARVNFFTKEVEYISEYPQSVLNAPGSTHIKPFDESLKIGFVRSHPNMFADELDNYEKYDGLILEGTGFCHFPINETDEFTAEHTKIKKKMEELAKKIPLVMSLQTISGSVNMNVYSPGRALLEMGVIGNYSTLCPETSFIKLAWLLSQKLDPKEYFMKDLRGEFFSKEFES